MNKMREEMIAPCGMNCSLCRAAQFKEMDLNKLGFHKMYCAGCLPRGKNCTHMKDACEILGNGRVRFCFECENYPCKRLKSLDKRYKTKYQISMIDNLNYIKQFGMEQFLKKEYDKWQCSNCGELICCHNGLCLNCETDKLLANKKYRWDDDSKK